MFKKINKLDGIPKIMVGKYAGTPIDQLPNSYLRWMIGQDFPQDWLRIAKKKLDASSYSNVNLNISRHAIDMYSIRFLRKWEEHMAMMRSQSLEEKDSPKFIGLGTFMAFEAERAWKDGEDVSKKRHDKDGIVKELDGIKWVFNLNPNFPEYKDVITVMPASVDWEEEDYCSGCNRPLSSCKCSFPQETLTNA